MEATSNNGSGEAPPPAASDSSARSQEQSESQKHDQPQNQNQNQETPAEQPQKQNPVQNPTAQPSQAQPAPAPANQAPQRRQIAPRDRYYHQSLGISLNSSVKQARVLMVGAGGIGCELLKNLVLTGFGEIHIVDLDTIDLSNLNRQFLFRHEHIKKSKALVAKDAAQKFNPNVQIVAHHANIKDSQFNVSWFRGFKVVFNALDNLEARRHVNKLCIAADVPLVESGTTGFNGQAQVIKKGVTACYDCTPKEAPKSYPVCTIRSTPSQPIHCIVWGKSYLLNEIFGTSEDQAIFDHSEDADNAKEIEELRRESEALKKIRNAVGTPEFPQMLFDKVFNADIQRLLSVDDLWKSRRAPEPLKYEAIEPQTQQLSTSIADILADGQKVWSLEENLAVFKDSLSRLSQRIAALKENRQPSSPEPVITFDKDDGDTLDFVTSSANIRSTIFGIDRKSKFDTKQMAGNIIPAIATTNAIVAGLCVLQSFKVLKGEYTQAKEVFLTPFAPARLLAPDRSREPNPSCPVCGVFNVTVTVDLSRATVKDIVDGFLRKHLGFGEKEFVLNNDVGIVYDPDETDNLPKKLVDIGIKNGSLLTVIDEDDNDTWININIDVEEGSIGEEEPPVKSAIAERPEIPRKVKPAATAEKNGHAGQNGDSSDKAPADGPKGVKRSNPDDGGQPLKKAKLAGKGDSDVVTVEDSSGAILIGD